MELKTTEGIAAEFARRNAAKAAKESEKPPDKVCIGCGKTLRVITCWHDREGPLCFDCWLVT